jgi:hypothetical protein
MHTITAVTSRTSLTIATPIPFRVDALPAGAPLPLNYRILRQARVVGGETLPLPAGVFVDLATNDPTNPNSQPPNVFFGNTVPIQKTFTAPPANQLVGAWVDVLFSPSGAVITPGLSQNTMNFWVRQPNSTSPGQLFLGNPTIIAVFAQTGLVGAYAPSPSQGPYVDIH